MSDTTIDIPGEWLADWSAEIARAYESTHYEYRHPTRGLCAGSGDVEIVVVPDSYQTSPDGRDWAGGGRPDIVVVMAYDGGYCAGRGEGEKLLRRAVESLDGLPSGMGVRHGVVRVRVRTASYPGHRSQLVMDRVIAEEAGRGIRYTPAPAGE